MLGQVVTLALGVFFGLGAFAGIFALVLMLIDRKDAKERDRKEIISDLRSRIRTLEADNERLQEQFTHASVLPDEEILDRQAPVQQFEQVPMSEIEEVRIESRQTRYDRIEDEGPPESFP